MAGPPVGERLASAGGGAGARGVVDDRGAPSTAVRGRIGLAAPETAPRRYRGVGAPGTVRAGHDSTTTGPRSTVEQRADGVRPLGDHGGRGERRGRPAVEAAHTLLDRGYRGRGDAELAHAEPDQQR